jgi:Sap-like sulfolipid-1-addressing protein
MLSAGMAETILASGSNPSLTGQLAAAIPLALVAGFSPTAVAVLIFYLGGEAPRRTLFAFLTGAAITTGLVAAAGIVILQGTGTVPRRHRSPSAALDLLLGAAMLVLAAVLARRPPRTRPPKQRRRDPRGAFLLGLLLYTPSLFYLAALKQIADADARVVATAVSTLIVVALVLVSVEVPIALYLLAPDRTMRQLGALNGWMRRHSRTALVGAAAAAGVYLVVRGVARLI